MQSSAKDVEQYLRELPADRRPAIEAIRKVFLDNLDKEYEEGMLYGMIGYFVPHSVFPAGYHCDPTKPLCYASLASQKNHMAIYLMCVYGDPGQESWFRQAWAKSGKKLDMGKSCIRFKKLEDVALDVIAEAVRRVPTRKYVTHYVATLAANEERKKARSQANSAPAPKKTATKKPAMKKASPAKAAKPAAKKRVAAAASTRLAKKSARPKKG